MAIDGEEIRAFDEKLFKDRLRSITVQKPDAITVSLMNSFANPKQYACTINKHKT